MVLTLVIVSLPRASNSQDWHLSFIALYRCISVLPQIQITGIFMVWSGLSASSLCLFVTGRTNSCRRDLKIKQWTVTGGSCRWQLKVQEQLAIVIRCGTGSLSFEGMQDRCGRTKTGDGRLGMRTGHQGQNSSRGAGRVFLPHRGPATKPVELQA